MDVTKQDFEKDAGFEVSTEFWHSVEEDLIWLNNLLECFFQKSRLPNLLCVPRHIAAVGVPWDDS
jgi:hypothetical protein